MFSLCWEIEELKALTESGRHLLVEMEVLIDVLRGNDEEHNLPRRICNLKNELIDFVKRLTRFKRVPATHISVIMISSELRRSKPYALPVQCLPYAGMSESNIRRLLSSLILEMKKHDMVVRGIPTTLVL